jgi:hypothetical protein
VKQLLYSLFCMHSDDKYPMHKVIGLTLKDRLQPLFTLKLQPVELRDANALKQRLILFGDAKSK